MIKENDMLNFKEKEIFYFKFVFVKILKLTRQKFGAKNTL